VKQALEKEEEERKTREVEERKRKENQMSQWEVNKAYAVQLRLKLEELLKQSGKKLSLNIETIQIFSLINMNSFPSRKTDIPKCLADIDAYIAQQEQLHAEHLVSVN